MKPKPNHAGMLSEANGNADHALGQEDSLAVPLGSCLFVEAFINSISEIARFDSAQNCRTAASAFIPAGRGPHV